ncbi:MAG: bifunctional hydroxymethylpyrimidine kinase/phosphomethylpyrimidine kinase [Acidobacteriota bacterium]|nr:MAG: bifunctional hydroxymethylpyrimidine kinase/phosphomethylpyrimidine kinase [Acidobacteriota bacterium]
MNSSATGRLAVKERLARLVESWAEVSLTVIGDAVLDEFEFGEIARVSREAPVLILDHRRSDLVPGGAGNTAANLAAIDVRVLLVGRVGDDPRGHQLAELLARRGVDVSGLIFDSRYPTPTKTRILAGSPHTAKQQIVRIDRGRRAIGLAADARRQLLSHARRARKAGSAVLLADYGYGLVDPGWIEELGSGPGPITLDSRFGLERFRGIDAATPNLEEVERALDTPLDDDDEVSIERAGRALRRRLGAQALLVTRGSRGMTLLENRRPAQKIAVFGSDEVADVTGAGDTVIAVFTTARAAGGSWREAAELANIAGGLVVMKRGTATVSREELLEALEEWSGSN